MSGIIVMMMMKMIADILREWPITTAFSTENILTPAEMLVKNVCISLVPHHQVYGSRRFSSFLFRAHSERR